MRLFSGIVIRININIELINKRVIVRNKIGGDKIEIWLREKIRNN